jgi:hypothetical protein
MNRVLAEEFAENAPAGPMTPIESWYSIGDAIDQNYFAGSRIARLL